MSLKPPERGSDPELMPIAQAAALAGLSVGLLESGIEAGQINVALHRIGVSAKRFVNAWQLRAWLAGHRPEFELPGAPIRRFVDARTAPPVQTTGQSSPFRQQGDCNLFE